MKLERCPRCPPVGGQIDITAALHLLCTRADPRYAALLQAAIDEIERLRRLEEAAQALVDGLDDVALSATQGQLCQAIREGG